MRYFVLIIIPLAILSISSFAQDKSGTCPVIFIRGPMELIKPGEIANYSVEAKDEKDLNGLQYNWSVSDGSIVYGQGTTAVSVRQPNGNLTVTVEINGLPPGCPKMLSETIACALPQPQAILMDEYAVPPPDKDLPTPQQNVMRKWANFEGALLRRADLIPNLITAAQTAGVQEQEVFGQVAEARSRLLNALQAKPAGSDGYKISEQREAIIDAAHGLEVAVTPLLRLQESYPQLRASEAFMNVQDELAGTENRINTARTDYDTAVQAVGLPEFNEGLSDSTRIEKIVNSLHDNPNTQLFVLSGHIGGKASERVLALEEHLLNTLESKGLERSRVTIVPVFSEREWMQFWLVPPGANIPRCKKCEELEKASKQQKCPTISLVGPAEDWTPSGHNIVFTANVSGDQGQEVVYKWTVSEGTILSGLHTPVIQVSTRGSMDDVEITVNVEVLGPGNCRDVRSIKHFVGALSKDPLIIDEFDKLPEKEEHLRFDKLGLYLKEHPDTFAYIIVNYKQGSSPKVIEQGKQKILVYLSRNWAIASERILFVRAADASKERTRILVVPSSSKSVPD
jgi:hypothetical protein